MSEAIERGGAALDLNAVEVRAADRAARTWEAGECGPIVLGSEAHKRAFCRMLLDTHNPYRPSIVDWPALDPRRAIDWSACRSGTSRCRPKATRACAC